uniref:Uncharacterized protein n=1 Tax=Salvator merianae TaxID=96440 RepID=A0A8D0DJ83_SALMN
MWDNAFDMSYNRTCCNFDLCNGGTTYSSSFQFLAGLSLAIGWWLMH